MLGSTPESQHLKSRQGSTPSKMTSKSQRQEIPEKVERPRSNSVSAAPVSQPASTIRKRTSSGVFHVDEAEPPTKKAEPMVEVSSKKNEGVPVNGRREGKEKKKDKAIEKDKRVIERFDSEPKTKCVTAFKESNSWD